MWTNAHVYYLQTHWSVAHLQVFEIKMSLSNFKIRASSLIHFFHHSLVPWFPFNEKRVGWGKINPYLIINFHHDISGKSMLSKHLKGGFSLVFLYFSFCHRNFLRKISSLIFGKGDEEKETGQKEASEYVLSKIPLESISYHFNLETVEKRTVAEMPKCHWVILGTVPSKNLVF